MREKNLSVPVINLVLHVQIVRVVHETSSEGNAQFAFQELRDRVINMHILPPNEYWGNVICVKPDRSRSEVQWDLIHNKVEV